MGLYFLNFIIIVDLIMYCIYLYSIISFRFGARTYIYVEREIQGVP